MLYFFSKPAVIQRHQDSINNAKNLTESESRRHSLLMQRDCEEAERAHGREIERLREDFERSMREKEERHRCKIREFQDRDNAWQQEKQVGESELSKLLLYFCTQQCKLILRGCVNPY